MSTTTIPATAHTPKIVLDFDQHYFSFEGEAFPEDVHAFFTPIITQIKEHILALNDAHVTCEFFLTYFNSASTKVFYNFFGFLESITEHNRVTINWKYHNDDDTAEEFGRDFQEDLENAQFNFVAI